MTTQCILACDEALALSIVTTTRSPLIPLTNSQTTINPKPGDGKPLLIQGWATGCQATSHNRLLCWFRNPDVGC